MTAGLVQRSKEVSMVRILIALMILISLGACGSHRRKKCSDSGEPDPWSYDYGGFDSGYFDPGYDDPGDYYDDGGDSWSDVSDEKASPLIRASVTSSVTVEVTNYDSAAYALYLEQGDPGEKWRKLYLPPLSDARAGGSSRTRQSFRLNPGGAYSLVLENSQGRILDTRPIGTGISASRSLFSVVGATLVDSQG
jgi:hypothetical protein